MDPSLNNRDALQLLIDNPFELMHPAWAKVLQNHETKLKELGHFLNTEFQTAYRQQGGPGFLPAPTHIFRALSQPPDSFKVLILGQDPYPTFGHPIGLCFAVDRDVRPIPRSLINIYQELHEDLGITPANHGDLSAWSQQGVMLLNRVLTVRPGSPASHRGKGWEAITEEIIRTLAHRQGPSGEALPLVAVLWGRDAQSAQNLLPNAAVITSAHPSPLSASRGFFGSRPFSRANSLLEQQGSTKVDWTVR